jgi:hypothetical protein
MPVNNLFLRIWRETGSFFERLCDCDGAMAVHSAMEQNFDMRNPHICASYRASTPNH